MPRLTSYKVIFLLVCIPFFLWGCGDKDNQLKSGDLIQLGFNQSNVKAVYIEETENTLTVSLGNDISGPPKVFNKDDIRYIEKRTKPVKLTAKTYKPSIKETVKPITKPAIVSSQEQSLKTSNNEIGLKKIYEAQGFNSYIASSIMGVVREGELFDFKVTVGGDLSDKRKVNLKYDGPELEIIDSSFTKSVINQEVVYIFEYEISAKAGNYDIYGVIDDGLETHKIAIKIFPKKKPSPEKFNSDKLENDYKVNLAKASEGDPEAQYRISFALLNGKGVIKNRSEGISWLRKSALSGFAEAQFALGGFYQNGVNGIEVDKLKATELYMKSANQGHPFAQFIVGGFFMNGENGFEVNKQIGIEWYKKSAIQEFGYAMRELDRLGIKYEEPHLKDKNYTIKRNVGLDEKPNPYQKDSYHSTSMYPKASLEYGVGKWSRRFPRCIYSPYETSFAYQYSIDEEVDETTLIVDTDDPYKRRFRHPSSDHQSSAWELHFPEALQTSIVNVCKSPHPPNNLLDITGYRKGDFFKDPTTNKYFRIAFEEAEKLGK